MKQSLSILLFVLMSMMSSSFTSSDENANYYNYGIPLEQLIHEPIAANHFSVLVQKSSYTLFLKYKGKLIKSYPCVFGPDPINDKRMEGDKRTPEGNFFLTDVREHFIWGYFLEINYPNPNSWQKHHNAKYTQEIPDTASIGGDLGLHGVVDGLEYYIDGKNNWTEGCVAMKNHDIIELAEHLGIGTPIKIVY